MLHIKQTVIVEGKYDKAKLANIIDAQIITTGGFDIYKDKEKRKLLIKLAKKNGIILLTDSDRAGFKIRGHITGFLPQENVIHLYVPQYKGKESRKEEFSKDGYLGVEGIENEILEKLFLPFASNEEKKPCKITKSEMYELGLFGRKDSSFLRDELCSLLELPFHMSSNALMRALDMMFSREEIYEAVEKITKNTTPLH